LAGLPLARCSGQRLQVGGEVGARSVARIPVGSVVSGGDAALGLGCAASDS
jgi:hypothetical protein